MPQDYELPFRAEAAAPNDLKGKDAIELCLLAGSDAIPFVRLMGCSTSPDDGGKEVVLLEVDVERPQRVVHDIRSVEPLAVVFPCGVHAIPEVLALRRDFPSVPHLNLRTWDYPKSLCLFEESPESLLLRWTALLLVERVREWLALTAQGILHQEDQPLEALLLDIGMTLVLPSDLLSAEHDDAAMPLEIYRTLDLPGKSVFVATRAHAVDGNRRQPSHIATWVRCSPRMHGVIARQPTSLRELADFTQTADFDLLSLLRTRLSTWQNRNVLNREYEHRLILVLSLPKVRREGGEIEGVETWAFLCPRSLADIGADIGVWEKKAGGMGQLIPPDASRDGRNIQIIPMRTVYAMCRDMAALYNGAEPRFRGKVTIVGVGALGSQVFMNLVRTGFGEWTLVDDDVVLPHNLARHALGARAIGFTKSRCLALEANAIIDGEPLARSIDADVLHPGITQVDLDNALRESDLIVDASVSVPVARHLARDVDSKARRASAFLNPAGTASVVLTEPVDRSIPLDNIEMQYYRFVVENPEMENHLDRRGVRQRYGNSCRDISFVLSQELISMHAGICARAIRAIPGHPAASASVWSINDADMTVRKHSIELTPTIEFKLREWTLQTDEGLLRQLHQAREKRLPNETGGILLGCYDMSRRVLYVVAAIPSPPDSVEWPTVYIRGCRRLRQRVAEIHARTGGNLVYVGEWHSHPDACSCLPSKDDMIAFAWLAERMTAVGLPPLMAIIGGENSHAFYLTEMGGQHLDAAGGSEEADQ